MRQAAKKTRMGIARILELEKFKRIAKELGQGFLDPIFSGLPPQRS